MRKIRVGTRRSRLAARQTDMVVGLIRARFPEVELEIVPLSTLGDRLSLRKRAEAEGKAIFTEEIESSLREGEVDLAVHSMKDLPNEIRDGLAIGATPLRGDPRDVLVSASGDDLIHLPEGARIGTSSLRRKAQLLSIRRDIQVVDLHGNVDTRLSKVGRAGIDGIVIAAAGLERLEESGKVTQYFAPEELVPAPAQGAIAVEMRRGDTEIAGYLSAIDDDRVRAGTTSERAFAAALGTDCDLPAGALASFQGGDLRLLGCITSPDGREVAKGSLNSHGSDPQRLGERLARKLLHDGGDRILRGIKR